MAVDGTSGEASGTISPEESGDIEVRPQPAEDVGRKGGSEHPEWGSGREELSVKSARGGTGVDPD